MNLPKYRGLTFDNKWVYGVPVKNPTHNTLTIVESITEDDINCWIVKPETIGQFTGLLDRNRIEIYEKDFLKGTSYLYRYDLPNKKQFNFCGIVEWQPQADVGLCYILRSNDGSAWNLNQCVHRNNIDQSTGIIIGNVYENPELVEKYDL